VALSVDTEHEPWPLSRRSPPQRAWGGVNPHSGPPSDGEEAEAEEVRGREVPGEEVDNVVIEEGAQVMMWVRVFCDVPPIKQALLVIIRIITGYHYQSNDI
jgi:hypothetical protein